MSKPAFGNSAILVMPRSIASLSRTLTILISTANTDATDCRAAHCPKPRRVKGVAKDGRMRGGRRDLLEQLQPFRRNAVFELGKAGDVASRPGQAFDDTEADRVDRLSKYNRNAAIRLE